MDEDATAATSSSRPRPASAPTTAPSGRSSARSSGSRSSSVDLLQLHNLVDEAEWRTALGPRGALEAAIEARDQGLVRFLGVTGHGWDVARRHRESLERHPFDSVLLPYNFPMMSHPEYARDFEALLELCGERGVAVQTIKSVARRRWKEQPEKRFSWYEPLRDEASVRAAVHYVLQRPGIFLNTSSDTTLLPIVLDAAGDSVVPRSDADMVAMTQSVRRWSRCSSPGRTRSEIGAARSVVTPLAMRLAAPLRADRPASPARPAGRPRPPGRRSGPSRRPATSR